MKKNRSYRFSHTISRRPGNSIVNGLRATSQSDPVPDHFRQEHDAYISVLEKAGVSTIVLPELEAFPDSVFVEDPVLCIDNTAVILRPGAKSRFGEAEVMEVDLQPIFNQVEKLNGKGFVDGGDILLTDNEALIGLSDRTDAEGVEELTSILSSHHYDVRIVQTPPGVLHFKSDCGLLDSETIFSTKALARSGCFNSYNVIEAPEGEEAAANLIRVNDVVILRSGFNKTKHLLEEKGYSVVTSQADEAAKVDGGLSCMSLRFSL